MIGVAFAGGGIKGCYEIGAYYALKDCGIKPTGFCGTSIGAFNAAMVASGKEKELLDFWSNIDSGKILGFEDDFVAGLVKGKKGKNFYKSAIKTITSIIKDKGIDTKNLTNVLNEVIDEELLRNSPNDFGVVTVKYSTKKPLMRFKEEMPTGTIKDHILASCFLPVFKSKKLIDDDKYLDGGLYDNCPINMLLDKGYDTIYAIKAHGIGVEHKVKENNATIVVIEPSRIICSIFELDIKIIHENIIMGYYDAMRVLKKYDGYKYSFKRKKDRFYDFITRKVDKRLLRRTKNFFHVKTNREVVIKSLEYLMEKFDVNYYNIYSVRKQIKRCKKNKYDNFIYEFVTSLRYF